MGNNYLQILIIVIIIGIVLFFIFRELNCWYWKINHRIKLMEEQNRLLNVLVKLKTEQSLGNKPKSEVSNISDNLLAFDANIQEEASNLKELFDKEKNKGMFGKSVRPEIITYLEKWCLSKDNCIQLIKVYQSQYNSDLIEELKKLSSSYDVIKDTLDVFIKFEIVEPEFPHNKK